MTNLKKKATRLNWTENWGIWPACFRPPVNNIKQESDYTKAVLFLTYLKISGAHRCRLQVALMVPAIDLESIPRRSIIHICSCVNSRADSKSDKLWRYVLLGLHVFSQGLCCWFRYKQNWKKTANIHTRSYFSRTTREELPCNKTH